MFTQRSELNGNICYQKYITYQILYFNNPFGLISVQFLFLFLIPTVCINGNLIKEMSSNSLQMPIYALFKYIY
jgi:uncharacterized protein YpmS